MGFMDELKKIIHPYDDEDYDYDCLLYTSDAADTIRW